MQALTTQGRARGRGRLWEAADADGRPWQTPALQGLPLRSSASGLHFSPLADLADLVAAAFARANIFTEALVMPHRPRWRRGAPLDEDVAPHMRGAVLIVQGLPVPRN